MARHFSVREFFRQMPNALLQRYFKSKGVLRDINFAAIPETKPDELFVAWLELSDSTRSPIEADFREIFDLSCEKGYRAIVDEVKWRLRGDPVASAAFVETLASLPGHFERAMTVFLDHPECWRGATYFYHADVLPYWRKRRGLPHQPASIDPEGRNELARAIGGWFRTAEGRGLNCHVELLRRGERDYFFVYPEDYSQQSLEWVEGEFSRRPHNPALEVVYVWSEQEGTLDLNHRGERKTIERLQEIFARTVLKLPGLPPAPKEGRVYDLNPLRRRDFQFIYDPGTDIRAAWVRRLRLSSIVRKGDRITLEADTTGNRLGLYDLIESLARSLPVSLWNVTQAEISVEVVGSGDKRPKIETFQVTWPNSCSLKYDELGLRLRAMLTASGIEPR